MSSEQHKKSTTSKKAAARKRKQRNKIILIVVELIVLIVLAVALFVVSKLDKIERPDVPLENIEVNEDLESETIEVMDSYRTIAVFGLNNIEDKSLTRGNSDVIMLVTINNETKEVKMCSVYRDTYLDIGNGKFRKCNAAYSIGGTDGKGGPEAAISMLNKSLDLNITDYVTINFDAVIECVDLLGGIELNLTDVEAVHVSSYMIGLNELTGRDSELPDGAGTYQADGIMATAYSRVRYTAGGDFERTERQREVIEKMVEKAQQSDLKTINKIIDQVFGDIYTNFSNADLISLASQIFDYSIAGSAGFPFDKNTINLGGSVGDVVVPCTLESNVIELHRFLYDNQEYKPSTSVKVNSAKIMEETGYDEDDASPWM